MSFDRTPVFARGHLASASTHDTTSQRVDEAGSGYLDRVQVAVVDASGVEPDGEVTQKLGELGCGLGR